MEVIVIKALIDQIYQRNQRLINKAFISKKTTKTIYYYYDSQLVNSTSVFIASKIKSCKQYNIPLVIDDLNNYTNKQLKAKLSNLAKTNNFLYFEYPLSERFQKLDLLQYLGADNDLDGILVPKLRLEETMYTPIAAQGVLDLLDLLKFDLNIKIVVIGRSLAFGKYIYNHLVNNHYCVDLFHTQTTNLVSKLENYDLVISTINKALVFSTNNLKANAYLIDATTVYYQNTLKGSFVIEENTNKRKIKYISTPNGIGKLNWQYFVLNYFKYAELK